MHVTQSLLTQRHEGAVAVDSDFVTGEHGVMAAAAFGGAASCAVSPEGPCSGTSGDRKSVETKTLG